jgi:hypothetical protein
LLVPLSITGALPAIVVLWPPPPLPLVCTAVRR